MTIIEAIEDPHLFKPLFKSLDSWRAWLVVLRAIFGLPMEEADLALFTQLTGRETPPTAQAEESYVLAGRRSGKSRMAATIAIFLACFRDYHPFLAAGERVSIVVLACDRQQARVIFKYCSGMLDAVPMLRAMVERETAETIQLNNGVDIEVATNSFRSLRGRTVGAAILDEMAFWRSELSTNPDYEVMHAIRPSLASIPNSLIVGIGSTYRRAGVLFDMWKKHYGKDSSTLVVQAASTLLNPTINPNVIAKAMEADPEAARSEWYAEFRNDLSAFLDHDVVERCIEVGCVERPPRFTISGDYVQHLGFVDPSGGQHDAMTLAIGHREGERLVLDVLRGVAAPFSPEVVVKEFAAVLRQYRLYDVTGDRYSGAWCAEAFQKRGIHYRYSDLSKSELYLESLASFSTGCVDLLDHKILKAELLQLERRTSRSGRDSVDHGPGNHDDFANATAGCLALLASHVNEQAYEIPILGV